MNLLQIHLNTYKEHSDLWIEHLTLNREVMCSVPTGVTMCTLGKHIDPPRVLVSIQEEVAPSQHDLKKC